MKVDGPKVKVAKLEHALERVIQSFSKFQNFASGLDKLPPSLALEISKTALDIASVARGVHTGKALDAGFPDDRLSEKSQDSPDDTKGLDELVNRQIQPFETAHTLSASNPSTISAPGSGLKSFDPVRPPLPVSSFTMISPQQNIPARILDAPHNTWFAAKLLRQCVERGVRLLTSPDMTYEGLHPALSIHLNCMSVDQLRVRFVQAMMSDFNEEPEFYPPAITLIQPNMYRSIEGDDEILVPRMRTRQGQQLIPGRTRTRLDTSLRDFQGEWLEPIDVQEYLEWKGIFVGSIGPMRILQLAIPENYLAGIWTQDAGAVFTEEIQRSRLMPSSWSLGIESQDLELRGPDAAATQAAGFPFPEVGRRREEFNALVPSNQEQVIIPHTVPEYSLPSEFYQSGYATQPVNVTLNLERLMRFLVVSACCIGPGPGMRKAAVDHALRVSIAVF